MWQDLRKTYKTLMNQIDVREGANITNPETEENNDTIRGAGQVRKLWSRASKERTIRRKLSSQHNG